MFLRLIARFLFLVFLFSCSQNEKPASIIINKINSDTTIYSEIAANGVCGPSERRKEKIYYLVVNNDTSNPICTVSENKYDEDFAYKGNVSIQIYFDEKKSYNQQLLEFEKVLQYASKEFLFDSLKGLTLGLWGAGDLAISITNQMNSYDLKNVNNNWKTAEFLLKSRLSTDMNRLFAPYKKRVKGYAIEHPMLTDSSFVINNRVIKIPPDQIPSKILTGSVWVYF